MHILNTSKIFCCLALYHDLPLLMDHTHGEGDHGDQEHEAQQDIGALKVKSWVWDFALHLLCFCTVFSYNTYQSFPPKSPCDLFHERNMPVVLLMILRANAARQDCTFEDISQELQTWMFACRSHFDLSCFSLRDEFSIISSGLCKCEKNGSLTPLHVDK